MAVTMTLGTVMLVLGFLSNVLGVFPGADASAPPIGEDTPFSQAAVEQTAIQFDKAYRSVIDDLLAFQRNPDLARAEARRTEMTAYAGTLAGNFQGLASTLQTRLDVFVATATADEPATP